MNDNINFYTSKTLECWDEVADLHAVQNSSLAERVSRPDFNALEKDFDRIVNGFDLSNKSVIQLCCNNGKDLISVKNKGAGYCLGIDGSEKFIGQAINLAEISGHSEIEFECLNVYDIPLKITRKFDFLILTVGVIGWMPNIQDFFGICTQLIKPGGWLLMEEIHPVLNMYIEGSPSGIGMSYFDRSAQKDTDGLDYFDGTKYQAKENYYFHHTLSDVLMASINNGLVLKNIEELAVNVGNYCADLEHQAFNPPLAFIASWQKST